jgi:hypothetical protein
MSKIYELFLASLYVHTASDSFIPLLEATDERIVTNSRPNRSHPGRTPQSPGRVEFRTEWRGQVAVRCEGSESNSGMISALESCYPGICRGPES